MNCEFNILGIAKGNAEDMRSLYEKMGTEVFAAAFAAVRNRKLARDIAVETFRRVRSEAYSFDTDYSGEFWVLDIATQLSLNALNDPQVSKNAFLQADNASELVTDALKLKNDRGFILLVKSCSSLSIKDVANLSGYYKASAGAEFRRACANLAEGRDCRASQIPGLIRKDMDAMCPDYYDLISDEAATAVAHISHEALGLGIAETAFTPETEEEVISERAENQKKASKKKLSKILIICGIFVFLALAVAAAVIHLNKDDKPDEDRIIQTGTTADMQMIDGILYYRTGSGVYSWNPAAASEPASKPASKPLRVSDAGVREMTNDGAFLYYRSADDGKIYSLDPASGESVRLSSLSGTSLVCFGDYVYFSASDGIYKVKKDGSEEPVCVYTDESDDIPIRYHMALDSDGTIVFSGGSDKGIFYLDNSLETPSVMALYFDEAYWFQLYKGTVYFDALEYGVKNIYALDVAAKSAVKLPLNSYTAAYYVCDDVLYYEGAVYGDDGVIVSTGLYKYALGASAPELLFDIPLDSTHISEIFVSDGRIYCYYSDGEKGGKRGMKAYSIDDVSSCSVINLR